MKPLATGYRAARRKPTSKVFYPTATPIAPILTDISKIPILMQNQLPFCVEHAIAAYMMWLVYKTTGKIVTLSPRFLAAYTVQKMGITPTQALTYGTSCQDALELLKPTIPSTGDGCVGICEDSFFPNDTTLPIEQYLDIGLISDAATANAAQYRISDFQILANTEETTIQQAIAQYGLALYAIDVSANWYTPDWQYTGQFPLAPPNTQYPKVGGHLICGNGWDTNTNDWFRNSWSADWGQQGNGYFAQNDLPFVYEAAIIEGLYVEPAPISPTPTPSIPTEAPVDNVISEIVAEVERVL